MILWVWLPVLFIVFASGCVQQGTQETGGVVQKPSAGFDVPVYEGSQSYQASLMFSQMMHIPQEGVTIKAYYVKDASVSDVLGWYENNLNGYELVDRISITTITTPQGSAEWGGLLFRKGEEAVGIWAMGGSAVEGGKGVVYYVAKGPASVIIGGSSSTQKEKLPSSDKVSGDEPIERYTGAIMLSYTKEDGYPAPGTYLRISYGTSDDMNSVADWYVSKLTSEGWSLGNEDRQQDAVYLDFSKGGEKLYIEVYAPDETREYTLISIDYAPNKLPAEDQASGAEPVKRYAGAVMLEYSTTTVQGTSITTIRYGTNDDASEVFNWYVQELPKAGWQIVSQSTSGGEYSLSAMKGSDMLQVDISQDAYTEISVIYSKVNPV